MWTGFVGEEDDEVEVEGAATDGRVAVETLCGTVGSDGVVSAVVAVFVFCTATKSGLVLGVRQGVPHRFLNPLCIKREPCPMSERTSIKRGEA